MTGGVRGVIVAAVVLGTSLVAMAPAARGKSMWIPNQGLQWQYQLQGKLNTGLCVVPQVGGSCVRPNVYDVDLYATNGVTLNTAAVAAIHAAGHTRSAMSTPAHGRTSDPTPASTPRR